LFKRSSASSETATQTDRVPVHEGRPFSPKDVRIVAEAGEIDVLKAYLEVKPEWANRQDTNGWSALHMAARNGDINVIEILLKAGADTSLPTIDGKNAKEIAIIYLGEKHPAVFLLE